MTSPARLSLRPMTPADLPLVEGWLRLPHVAHWWTPDTTAEEEIAKYRERVRRGGQSRTRMLTVSLDSRLAFQRRVAAHDGGGRRDVTFARPLPSRNGWTALTSPR